MKLDIEIDKRNKGKYFQKNKGIRSSKEIRELAIKDMAKETGQGEFYHIAYLSMENRILSTCDVIVEILTIDTCIL